MFEYGDPEIWATVNWGGTILKSKKIRNQQLNETFYFQIAISKKLLKNANKNKKFQLILSELKEKPEIEVNVWLDPKTGVYEHLGSTIFELSSIDYG